MNNFLPDDYEIPKQSGGYMKFTQGDNRFRILSNAIIGYEGWTRDNKPLRQRMGEDWDMTKIVREPRHFWAFVVWNYDQEAIVILEITQTGIMKSINQYVKNEKWGDPKEYDIVVNRVGEGKENTVYSVTPNPKEKLDKKIIEKYEEMKINLEVLYDGEDPFAEIAEKEPKEKRTPESDTSDLPF